MGLDSLHHLLQVLALIEPKTMVVEGPNLLQPEKNTRWPSLS